MQFVLGTTNDTATLIPLPNCEFDSSGNDSAPAEVQLRYYGTDIRLLDCYEAKPEYDSNSVVFVPGVDQVKDSVIRPYSSSNFL